MFGNEIESSIADSDLHLDKVKTARTVMHGTERLIKTAFNEVDSTLKTDGGYVSNNEPNKESKESVNSKKDEIDGFFQSLSKPTASNLQKADALDGHDLKHMKKTKSTKSCSKDDRANKFADVSIGTHTLECNDDDNSQEMSAYDYEKYKKSYIEMDDVNKWVLTTGTVVEELFTFANMN
ncbi:4225_t:CDS:2, partial [Paraglomus brasilianum]